MIEFLIPIFQSLIASVIYGVGVVAIDVAVKCRPFKKRYKKAFEKAICRFYANPDMVGNEARRNYDDYFKMLQDASKQEDILASNNHVYKKLYALFAEEVSKDKLLLGYTLLRNDNLTHEKLDEIQNKVNEAIDIIKKSREQNQQEHKEISEKLDVIKKLVTKPEIQEITITTLKGTSISQTDEQSHIIARNDLVDRCIQAIESNKLLILYGALRVGKSTLAGLIVNKKPEVKVLDDVPFPNLDNVVRRILADNSDGIRVVVTSAPLNVNFSILDFSKIEQVEVPLLTVSEVKELVRTYNPKSDYSVFITGFSGGHPMLVRTLCTYLSSLDWTIDEKNFSSLLNYSFDANLLRTLSDLLSCIITDKDTRNLFNRLLLIIGDFNEDIACKLASINPEIDEPRRRLYTLIPSWLSNKGNRYKVNPLFGKAWKADISADCCKACNKILADNIMRLKRPLVEMDVMNYINYSVRASEFDDAGEMLIMVLNKFHDAGEKVPDNSLLRVVWIDIPLPVEMSINVRIGIRIAQLLLIDNLSKTTRQYLLWDLKHLVEDYQDSQYKAFYYNTLAMLCWQEEDMAEGLKYYELYKALPQDNSQVILSKQGESLQLFDNNIWYFLLQLSSVDDYDKWLETFRISKITYSHKDNLICECCYMSITRFTIYHLKDSILSERLDALNHIKQKADECGCTELAITCLAQIMDLYTSDKQLATVQSLYSQEYDKYKEFPLTTVLLNGAMANSYYRSGNKSNNTWQYYENVIDPKNPILVSNVQLHIKQLYAYVVAQTDIDRCILLLKEALEYAADDKHRGDVFEYYQCKGELAYAYWTSGQKEKAVNALSSCMAFVLPQAEAGRQFAKTYLCLCNCLLNMFCCEIQRRPIREDDARPHHGMFTENDLLGLDDLYTEDRQYVSCYMMGDLCENLQLKNLSYEWACKAIEATKRRGGVQETHYMLFLFLPMYVIRNDFETIKYIINQSTKAKQLTYQNHPEMNKGNADLELVEFQLVPLLMRALVLKMNGEEIGMQIVREVLDGYTPLNDEEVIRLVKESLSKDKYDREYIAEINKLNINEKYSVYICAYLITAVHSDADYAFSLLMCLLPNLEDQLVKVIGSSVKEVINLFVSSFWKDKILKHPEEFKNYAFLQEKGIKVIESYKGKINQANHTMLVVSNHLKKEPTLNKIQEDWLYLE